MMYRMFISAIESWNRIWANIIYGAEKNENGLLVRVRVPAKPMYWDPDAGSMGGSWQNRRW